MTKYIVLILLTMLGGCQDSEWHVITNGDGCFDVVKSRAVGDMCMSKDEATKLVERLVDSDRKSEKLESQVWRKLND